MEPLLQKTVRSFTKITDQLCSVPQEHASASLPAFPDTFPHPSTLAYVSPRIYTAFPQRNTIEQSGQYTLASRQTNALYQL